MKKFIATFATVVLSMLFVAVFSGCGPKDIGKPGKKIFEEYYTKKFNDMAAYKRNAGVFLELVALEVDEPTVGPQTERIKSGGIKQQAKEVSVVYAETVTCTARYFVPDTTKTTRKADFIFFINSDGKPELEEVYSQHVSSVKLR